MKKTIEQDLQLKLNKKYLSIIWGKLKLQLFKGAQSGQFLSRNESFEMQQTIF